MGALSNLWGRILGAPAAPERAKAPQPLQMVPGGPNAPLLGPQPVDGDLETLSGSWISQVKVDGVRAFYIEGPAGPLIVTREGQPLNCALHCLPGLQRVAEAYGEPMVIDGEYVEEEGFNATLSAMRKGEGTGVFWMFDAVPFSQWEHDRCTVGTALRLARLRDRAPAAESPFVGLLEPRGVNGPMEIGCAAGATWAAGYEGIVLKDPAAPYQRRRTDAWQRVKQEVTHDCPVIDALWKDGRLQGLIVKGPNGPVKVTSGFSSEASAMFAPLTGSEGIMCRNEAGPLIVEIAYTQRASTTKIATGRFVRIRHDKRIIS